MEKIFVAIINGNLYRKNTAIRTYKTRERAEREVKHLLRYDGYKVQIAELNVANVKDVKEDNQNDN